MNRKAGIVNIIGWIAFFFAILLLVLLFRNDMNFPATVKQILSVFN